MGAGGGAWWPAGRQDAAHVFHRATCSNSTTPGCLTWLSHLAVSPGCLSHVPLSSCEEEPFQDPSSSSLLLHLWPISVVKPHASCRQVVLSSTDRRWDVFTLIQQQLSLYIVIQCRFFLFFLIFYFLFKSLIISVLMFHIMDM